MLAYSLTHYHQALALLDFGFLTPEQHTYDGLISSEIAMQGIKYAFMAILTWGIAMMFIKISVIIMLLRIPIDVWWRVFWWRVFCWLMIFIQIAWCIGNTTFVLLQCDPIEAQWNPAVLAKGGSCLSVKTSGMASNAAAGVNICTDILISLAPAAFLWRLRQPVREKVLIGVLMSLGIFASISSIIKMTLIKKFTDRADDIWAVAISIATYTMLEQLLALTAASAPYLKPILQRTMHRFGVSFLDTESQVSFRRPVGESTLGREAVECHVPAEDTYESVLLEQGGVVRKEKGPRYVHIACRNSSNISRD